MTSNNSKNKKSLGFGFIPEETQYHFLVVVPRDTEKDVAVYERSLWQEGSQAIDHRHDILKVLISKQKWDKIKSVFAHEFNTRLKSKKYSNGKWITGKTPVHRLLGKEMMILAWAVADCDPTVIDTAIKNWLGLRPEERWWLYTMTNATSGRADDNFGWRKALRYALTENPIMDSTKKPSLFSNLSEEDL